MSMKKGYCTNCNKHDESRRIFDVNSETRFCYCPHCGKKYRPRIAIANYERIINKYLRKARFFLRNAGETLLAYNLYAYVLELEPGNKTAKLGRLLSLCYLSNLRRNRFKETRELLSIEREDYHTQGIRREYVAFLLALSNCIDVFLTRSCKKLTFKHYFYDIECVKLYFKQIVEALELKRLIVEELSVCEEEKQAANVSKTIKMWENVFNESFFTIDGQEHNLLNFTKAGDPLIVDGKRKEDTTKYLRFRPGSLDVNDKKARYIKDEVFSNLNRKTYHFIRVSFVLFTILAASTVLLFILYFIFMKYSFSLVILIIAGILGVSAITFIVLRLIYDHKLKNHLVD